MPTYYFYLQKTNKNGVASAATTDKKNLESDFSGLKYISCTGLTNMGKTKNIYSESFAESTGEKIYHPSDVSGGTSYNESTTIELTLLFVGDSRRDTYDSFCSFLKSSRMFYWDTARHRKAWVVFKEASEPSEDTLTGSVKYLKASFKLTNLWGRGKKCNDSGTLI